MGLSNLLQNIGFTDKEALIYLVLLELNEALPSTIARKSGIKRPTTYVILEQLEKKGVVSHVIKNKSLFFRASSPNFLFEDQKRRFESLKKALPELISLNKTYESTPQMSVFQGKEGLIQIMEDTLTTKEPLLCWCDVDLAVNTILSDYFPTYLAKKVKNKIRLKGIFCYDEAGLRHKKNQEKELREVYLVPKEKFPFKNEINIYDDKVAILSYRDAVGVIIQNQDIADTQKLIFNLGFEYAKILEKDLLTEKDRAYLSDNN